MVTVPSTYVPLVQQAAAGTGIPYSVVAAQANAESGFNASAVSPAGAEGWLQFLPSTYDSVAARAGVSPGTEFNPADETKAYIVYMNDLLKQEGGSIFKALEAYNAGPGNLGAGAGYANSIMAAAGVTANAQAGQATGNVSTTGLHIPNPLNIGSDIFGNLGKDVFGWLGSSILSALGLPSLKDLLQRAALIILGFVLVLVGIHLMTGGTGGGQPIQITTNETPEGTTTKRQFQGGGVKHTKTTTSVKGAESSVKGAAKKGIATEAVEAAAVALW